MKDTDHVEDQEEADTPEDGKEAGHGEGQQEEEVVENKRSSKVYKYIQNTVI